MAGALAAFTLGLTFNGTMLMLIRAFFSLQSPWVPTTIALANLGVNAALDAAFYRYGTWGIPLATSFVNMAGTFALIVVFRRRIGQWTAARSSVVLPHHHCLGGGRGVAAGVWYGLDQLLGRGLFAQILTVGSGSSPQSPFTSSARDSCSPGARMLLSLRRRSGTTGE